MRFRWQPQYCRILLAVIIPCLASRSTTNPHNNHVCSGSINFLTVFMFKLTMRKRKNE